MYPKKPMNESQLQSHSVKVTKFKIYGDMQAHKTH